MNLSIVILTFNSQRYLQEVLKSVQFANEVIIVDSGSTDDSLKIANTFDNVKIFHQNWLGFAKQKQFGVDKTTNEWVFILDSDEIFTKKLEKEVLQTIKNPIFKAYKVARLNFFFGKAITRMGLYPDYNIRLFHKKYAKFNEREVHESIICKEKIGFLQHYFLHYAYESIEQFINKQNIYSSLNPKKNNFIKAIINPYWTFFKLYFIKLGFLEGKNGFIIAKLYAQYTFWKYIK
ncbi:MULTISPECIES: glycosyltransferase family 2 protein [Campylobacter]|uniref:glycosyltransferase family 2 protein n=1 Tax=Campylobacter TaxID=194 RepID=UPI0019072678|nr:MULTISPECIES: glycosyltransferase family 2 protein [unclassified Campylobacter]MBZ7928895.1 glycosyltransferase family 2 protein [Campylobacter sp. RM10542]MBZ7940574.1 glycosyltransferase family 2 protein [Campylobacter sp. W0047]MBZ7943281.1 glycosyltransferase family 2 protein [Campylobacter sp. RM13744]MBZ7949034.1 glycosyltransferase family 2 protein [Campylobacter sp. RM10534]MBZ7961644.1 glycosyltransferase family 2 protein [Campylobacter sp. RM9930]